VTKRQGIWQVLYEGFLETLHSSKYENPEVRMTIEELKRASGTKMSIQSLQSRGFWQACREGRKDFDTHTRMGLVLQEHLDSEGRVRSVSFRLATSAVAT
jgi:hypothetical protein